MRRHKMLPASAGLWLMLALASVTWMVNVGPTEASESARAFFYRIFNFHHHRNSRRYLKRELDKCLEGVYTLHRSISHIYDKFVASDRSNYAKKEISLSEELNKKTLLLHQKSSHCNQVSAQLKKLQVSSTTCPCFNACPIPTVS